ncbi:MAG: hypothetical protein RLZZ237_1323, partial [Pseudomonadota bacterium]
MFLMFMAGGILAQLGLQDKAA